MAALSLGRVMVSVAEHKGRAAGRPTATIRGSRETIGTLIADTESQAGSLFDAQSFALATGIPEMSERMW